MPLPYAYLPGAPGLPAQERQSVEELFLGSPFADFEILEVTFGAANVDLDIRHHLSPKDAEGVGYLVLRADRATSIYDDHSGTRKPWTSAVITLRSSVADAQVQLLLIQPRS